MADDEKTKWNAWDVALVVFVVMLSPFVIIWELAKQAWEELVQALRG